MSARISQIFLPDENNGVRVGGILSHIHALVAEEGEGENLSRFPLPAQVYKLLELVQKRP